MNDNWVIKNSPFDILDIAFKKLFPDIEYAAYIEPNIRPGENGEKVYGLCDFADDGEITIFIDAGLNMMEAAETFCHELAHAAVGIEQRHDEVWEKAFDDLFQEYNKIGDELFGGNQ